MIDLIIAIGASIAFGLGYYGLYLAITADHKSAVKDLSKPCIIESSHVMTEDGFVYSCGGIRYITEDEYKSMTKGEKKRVQNRWRFSEGEGGSNHWVSIV